VATKHYAKDEKFLSLLGKRIKELRKGKGLTQEGLANEAEIGLAQVKRIEAGNINTSICSIYRITIALNINVSKLFEELE